MLLNKEVDRTLSHSHLDISVLTVKMAVQYFMHVSCVFKF